MSDKAVRILTSSGHFYINLGLERIGQILSLLGNPQDKLKCIHVAGTNGKGSVCSILDCIIQKNGYKTGLFTSPHIFEYNERIKINGKNIPDDIFDNIVENITELAKKNNIHLTEFEILTATAFVYFEGNNVDYVILETGLGGRFDATNIIKKCECSIITHLDLEHTERLGNTIEEISFEKAGIIKAGCSVIIGENNSIIADVAEKRGSKLYISEKSNKKCSLIGEHQKFNLGLALKACEVLGLRVKDEYLLYAKNPLRFEILENDFIVDVAHNPDSINMLRKNLDTYFKNQSFDFIFGCLSTKDYKKMLNILLKENDRIYVYEFSNPNSCDYETLSRVFKKNIFKFSEYKKTERKTVICGSFYMLKELFNEIGIKYNLA